MHTHAVHTMDAAWSVANHHFEVINAMCRS